MHAVTARPGVTPWRVVSILVVPPTATALVCAWWALDASAYAYRLYRDARRALIPNP